MKRLCKYCIIYYVLVLYLGFLSYKFKIFSLSTIFLLFYGVVPNRTTSPYCFFLLGCKMDKKININKFTSDDAYALLEDIPSEGSDISESENEDNDEPIDIDMPNDIYEEDANSELSFGGWDSEDDLPLTSFLPKGKVNWTNNPNYVTSTESFAEPFGANVPDNLGSPVDFFLHLFSKNLLNKIVFETNLYAVQKHGTIGKPTNLEEIKRFLALNI